ncbi:hypothetical protein [Roseomonas genomospecies 6]|uniref:hypothetical protein n=1 Tax=Roseomonas genomospecies 6 TaxID=214106 RepID=UPI001AD784C2|nr:hypothetical protein [Roseomonas genomospecies 6]
MKAIALKRVLLAASLLVPTACADRFAECPPSGEREMSTGSARCATDAAAPEVALDHGLDRGLEGEPEPVLSVAPPQRRKARPAMQAQTGSQPGPQSPRSLSATVETMAKGESGQRY